MYWPKNIVRRISFHFIMSSLFEKAKPKIMGFKNSRHCLRKPLLPTWPPSRPRHPNLSLWKIRLWIQRPPPRVCYGDTVITSLRITPWTDRRIYSGLKHSAIQRADVSRVEVRCLTYYWNGTNMPNMSRVYNCSTGFRARSKARRGNVPRPHDACKLQKCLRLHPLFCRITFNYNFLVHVYVSLFTTIVASVRTAQRSSYTALEVLA